MAESSTFTPDAARSLDGPDWLVARRVAAAERAAAAPWPTTDDEVWRYSRIGDLDLDAFSPMRRDAEPPAPTPPAAQAPLDDVGSPSGIVVQCNGRTVRRDLDPALAASGVTLCSLADLEDADDLLANVADRLDVFDDLNEAFATEPVVLDVAPGAVVERPVVVVHWTDGDRIASFPRLIVRAGENSEVTVLEEHASGPAPAVVAPRTDLVAGPAARLQYVHVQRLGPATHQVARRSATVERDATLVMAEAALGGSWARTRLDCTMAGRGSSSQLLAAYFGDADETFDFRTFQDHVVADTTSELVFHGALAGRSRAVYTGTIKVRPEARRTNAFQTNRNLKLSDEAWAESVPNLEIENNDVRCSHASTIGPIDEDQAFYLHSRGVPPAVAERLIVRGFFADVLARFPVPERTSGLVDHIGSRLAAQGAA